MNETWKPLPAADALPGHPLLTGELDSPAEQQDTLNASGPRLFSDIPASTLREAQEELAQSRKRLQQLRNRPAFKLIARSTLLVQTFQLDMDYPPRLKDYLREHLKALLLQHTGKALQPDKLKITFRTASDPSVDNVGKERYSKPMSLTRLAVLSCNPSALQTLLACKTTDAPLDKSTPQLTAHVVLQWLGQARWAMDYTALIEGFWGRHRDTYRALAKLGFLDDLARHYAQARISREGYELALNALGSDRFPDSPDCLEQSTRGTRTTAFMLSLNGWRIPGIFVLKSHNTAHCFIHMPGNHSAPLEYSRDDPQAITQKLIEIVGTMAGFDAYVDIVQGQQHLPLNAELEQMEEDVFSAMADAEQRMALGYLADQAGASAQPDPLKAIARGLTLMSAVDIWQEKPDILEQLPTPLATAAELMREGMQERFGEVLNPDHVFIRYLRGQSITPLGSARQPVIDLRAPSEQALSLSEALVNNYRVAQPVGYIDHGGRTVVYLDSSGEGRWPSERELPVLPENIEAWVRGIDFMAVMNQRIEQFWSQQHTAIDESLHTHFLCQAVASLKLGSLRRRGFDRVVEAMKQLKKNRAARTVRWSVPSFFVQHSLLEGPREQYCPSLWILSVPGDEQRVLYQAGMLKGFVEFGNQTELDHYLLHAARSLTWRKAVLDYVPLRQHERLNYILKVWSGVQPPDPPTSVFRPWTDVLYHQDVSIARADGRTATQFADAPFAYVRETLKLNRQLDAEDQIVTAQEVSLSYWKQQLNHLQTLLAPMSLLLTPALMASLAVEISTLLLTVAATNLPGARHAEKKQLMTGLLSLGLLQLSPHTPRLLKSLGRFSALSKLPVRSAPALPVANRGWQSLLRPSLQPGKTRLEAFFYSKSLLKSWTVPGHSRFGGAPVKAWKLQDRFMLWTGDRAQARTLVVSSHGYYLPWTKNARIPNGTELQVYAPHGHELIDPTLHRVVSRKLDAFARLTPLGNTPGRTAPQHYVLSDTLMAGTSRTGMIKNYSLSKFQSPNNESYADITSIVRHSNRSPLMGQLPTTPMDVLTIRNRFGLPAPTLEKLFNALFENGIHYDRILLLHCRCAAFKSLLGMAPVYKAP